MTVRLARRPPARTRGLTGRALALGVALVLMAVVLASPLHRYLAAQSALAATQQASSQNAADLARLQAQRKQWQDPSFVMAQARDRLQYAKPGETTYVVIRPGDRAKGDAQAVAPSSTTVVGNSWSSRLWSSVRAADKSS